MRIARWQLAVIPAVTVGVVAAFVTITVRGADPSFVFEQQHPATFGPTQLEAILIHTREPVATGAGPPATQVRCIAGTQGAKLNPWRCQIRYASGQEITYVIEVQPNGRFQGTDATGARVVGGCCLRSNALPSG